MKTAHTIPWEAVVQGCPPSQAKRLPLVVSTSCANFDPSILADALHELERADHPQLPHAGLEAPGDDPDASVQERTLAMVIRTPQSSLVELPLPQQGAVAQFTSDNETSVILQTCARPLLASRQQSFQLRRDAFARAYVARYSRFDADARAFKANDSTTEEDNHFNPNYQFINSTTWGFSPTSPEPTSSMHWTAHNLFRSPAPSKPRVKPSPATRQRFKDLFEEPTIDRGDPFQCLPQLRQFDSLCRQSLNSARAYGLTLCLGRCRLFGVKLNDAQDFTLTPVAFDRAAAELVDLLRDTSRWATQLETKADTFSPYLQRNCALDLLEIRMDAHATYLALDEAYAAATYECEPAADTMGRRLNQVRRVINLFDGNLQKQLPLLRLAASTFLLENWRRLLAPCYRDLPPWWLDGCLE